MVDRVDQSKLGRAPGTGERSAGLPIAVIQADIYPIPKRDFDQFEKNPKFFQTAR